jgi:uncharacterized OB-fold protein
MPKQEKTVLQKAIDLLEEGEEFAGVCKACGAIAYEVEPDARNYACEECGEDEVFGAEEIVISEGF